MTDTNTAATGAEPTPDQVRTAFLANLRETIREELRSATSDPDSGSTITTVDEAATEERRQMEAFEARMAAIEAAQRVGFVPGAGQSRDPKDQFNLGRVVKSLVTGDRRDAEAEWKMSDIAYEEMRAQATAPDTAGGFIVPGQVFTDQIIPLLRPMLVARELGAVELAATTTPVEIPKEATAPTVDAVAENEANNDADVSFGMMRMEPHTAQSFIKASRRFLTMGAGADTFLRRRMSEEIAIEINRWALKGTGAGNEPLGVLNHPGVNTVSAADFGINSTNDLAVAGLYQHMRKMELQIANDDALMGSLGWAVPPVIVNAAHQMKTGNTGAAHLPTSRVVFSDGDETSMLGYQFRRTTQLSSGSGTTEMIFGDWSRMVMARWGTVVIEASNTANDALQKRQTHIVAYMDIDIGITQPTGFCITTDLSSTIS